MLITLAGKKGPKHVLMVRQYLIQIPKNFRDKVDSLLFGHYLVCGAQYWRNIDLRANSVVIMPAIRWPVHL
jgi:hypothetical protein